jgi:hypothetical protein
LGNSERGNEVNGSIREEFEFLEKWRRSQFMNEDVKRKLKSEMKTLKEYRG